MAQNRQQRRAAKKAAPKKKPDWTKLTREERQEKLFRNGITDKDLKKAFDDGYKAGFTETSDSVIKTIYAAICLALNDEFGFGRDRCARALNRTDYHVLNTLTSQEIVDDVYNRMKLAIYFKEPFDRVVAEDDNAN